MNTSTLSDLFRTRTGRKSSRRQQARPRFVSLWLEGLERRLAPATLTWLGTQSSNWSVANNWTGAGRAPQSGDTLLFSTATTATGTFFYSSNNDISGLSNLTISLTDNDTVTGHDFTLTGNGVTLAGLTAGGTDAAGTMTVGLALGGSGAVSQSGSGTLTLTGVNSYSGSTTVSAGTLKFSNQVIPSASASVSSGATLEYANSSNLTQPGITFTGAGRLKKSGTGILTFGGSGTVNWNLGSGAVIDVQEGILVGGSSIQDVWTNNLADLNIASGAEFRGVEANLRIDALTGSGLLTTGYSVAGYINTTIGVDNGSGTFSGIIADTTLGAGGAAVIVKAGGGTQIFAGNNTYTGTTTIASGGILQIGNGGTAGRLGSGAVIDHGVLQFNRSDTLTVPNAISGNGQLTQAGTGTVILTGNNTYGYATTINSGGTLQVGNGGATGSLGGAITNNGTLVFNLSSNVSLSSSISGSGGVTQSGPGTLTLSGNNSYTGTTTVSGGSLVFADRTVPSSQIQINSGATLAYNVTSGNLTQPGTTIKGAGTLAKNGGGQLTFGGAGTVYWQMGAGGLIQVNAGTLVGGSSYQDDWSGNQSDLAIAPGATFAGVEANVIVNGLYGGGTLTTGNNGQDSITVGTGSFSGVIADSPPYTDGSGTHYRHGNLTKVGTGTLTLSGNNSYSGVTTVSGGSLVFLDHIVPSSQIQINSGATLTYNVTAGDLTQPGTTISGTGTLAKFGASKLTFGGAGTVQWKMGAGGLIQVNDGTLVGGSNIQDDWSGNHSDLAIAQGATFAGVEANVIVNGLYGGGTLTTGFNGAGYSTFTVGSDGGGGDFSGVIAGSNGFGSLTKAGSGTLTLGGTADNHNLRVTVNGGTLILAKASSGSPNVHAVGAGLTINNGATVQLGGSGGDQIFDGNTVTVNSGTLDLNGQSETVTMLMLNGGTISNSGSAPSFLSATSGVTLGSSSSVGGSGRLIVVGGISGAAGLTKTGTGTVILSNIGGTSSYAGGTTVSLGTLAFANQPIPAGSVNVAGGATLQYDTSTDVTQPGGITLSGAGTLLKTGSGTLTFGGGTGGNINWRLGQAGQAGGLIDVQGGTLVGGSWNQDDWTNNYASMNVATGATFRGVEANVQVDALTGGGTVQTGFSGAGYSTITVGVNNTRAGSYNQTAGTATFSGVIADAAASGNLTKAGSGTQALTGANSYGGGTTISGGTLQVGDGTSNGSVGTDPVSIGAGGALQFKAAAGTPTFSNALSGSGGLRVAADDPARGALILAGDNSGFSGPIAISGGRLGLGSATALGAAAVPSPPASSSITVSGTGQLYFGGVNSLTVYAPVTISGFGYSEPAGQLGAIRFSGANDVLAGPVTVSGTARVGAFGTSGTISGPIGGSGTLEVGAGGGAAETVVLTSSPAAFGGNLKINSNVTLQFNSAGTLAVPNAISGSGTLTQAGGGTVILTGANSYTGGTAVSGGVLQFNTNSLPNSGSVNVNLGGSAAFGYEFDTNTLKRLAPNSAGVVALAADCANDLDFSSAGANLSGVSLGASGNFTYSGTLTPAGGTYRLGGGGGTLTVSSALTGSNRSLVVGLNGTATGAVILTATNTYGGTTISSGTLQIGDGTTSGPTAGRGSLGSGAITDNGLLKFNLSSDLTVSQAISGSGALTQAGSGTLTLSGANTYSGTTTISGGTLQVGGGGTAGSLGSGGVADNGTLIFNLSSDLTVSQAISGSGALTQAGSGTLTLSGANTYSGTTTISGGTLRAGAAGALSASSAMTLLNTAWATLDLNGFNNTIASLAGGGSVGGNVTLGGGVLSTGGNNNSTTFGGAVSGSGGLTKTGAGTLTLTGNNEYSGGTTISGGALRAGSDSAFGTGWVTVNPGGVIDVNGHFETVAALTTLGNGAGSGAVINTAGGAAGGVFTGNHFYSSPGGEYFPDALVHSYSVWGSVAADGQGNIIHVWRSQSGATYPVLGQRFTSSGQALGPQFVVTARGDMPVVAADAQGNFIVAWRQFIGNGIYSQCYSIDATGAAVPVGNLNTQAVDTAQYLGTYDPLVAVSADDNGHFFVHGLSYNSYWVRGFTTTGTWVISQMIDDVGTLGPYSYGAGIAAYGQASFVVTWMKNGEAYASVYASGKLGASIDVGTGRFPRVAADDQGNFVVAWQSDGGVFARRYTTGGQAQGPAFQVNTSSFTNSGFYPEVNVASDGQGNFIVVYQADAGICAQRYNSAGQRVGGEFPVNSGPYGSQPPLPAIAVDGQGRYTVSWVDASMHLRAEQFLINQSPTANVGGATYAATYGTAVDFNGSASSDPEGSQLTYVWSFGDGTTYTESPTSAPDGVYDGKISHTYTGVGSYTATLTVIDGKYVASAASTTVTVSPKALTVSAAASNKVYDGGTAASVTLSDNRVAGDNLQVAYTSAAFTSKNAGAAKTVSVSGISLSGPAAANYTLQNTTATTTATISQRVLAVTASGVNRVYDGTTAATVSLSDDRVAGDAFTVSYASAAFADKNVGAGKAVTVSGIAVGGADAANYTFNTPVSTTADITARSLTVSAAGVNKEYDGTTAATVTLSDHRVSGDALTVSYGGAAFADKNAGAGKAVTVSGISLSVPFHKYV